MLPKLIALDLDETLLSPTSQLPIKNRLALEAAIRQGVEIVIASGRAYSTLPAEMTAFPGIRYAICGNGAAVYDIRQENRLRSYTVPPEALDAVLAVCADEDCTYEAFVDGTAYAQADYIESPWHYLIDAQTSRYLKESRRPVPEILVFLQENRERLDSFDVVVADFATKERITAALQEIPGIYVTTSVPRLIEISHANCGKHSGMRFLCDLLGISQAETAAFGNADNDADMLRWAGTGVAVENASPGCKAAADYITGDYRSDGVAEAFYKLWGLGE